MPRSTSFMARTKNYGRTREGDDAHQRQAQQSAPKHLLFGGKKKGGKRESVGGCFVLERMSMCALSRSLFFPSSSLFRMASFSELFKPFELAFLSMHGGATGASSRQNRWKSPLLLLRLRLPLLPPPPFPHPVRPATFRPVPPIACAMRVHVPEAVAYCI